MPTRVGFRRRRRAENRKFRLTKPVWQDPFPAIPGTEPEKRLFEAMVRRRLYFVFQDDLPEFSPEAKQLLARQLLEVEAEIRRLRGLYASLLKRDPKLDRHLREKYVLEQKIVQQQDKMRALQLAGTTGPFLNVPGFQPDIVLPEYKVILDPFGIFHHSLPDAVKRDAVKSVVYRSLGYGFYHPWWDGKGFLWEQDGRFERLGFDANAVLARVVEFRAPPTHKLTDPRDIEAKRTTGYRLGKDLGAGAFSVAIANAKRTRQKNLTLKVGNRRRRSSRHPR